MNNEDFKKDNNQDFFGALDKGEFDESIEEGFAKDEEKHEAICHWDFVSITSKYVKNDEVQSLIDSLPKENQGAAISLMDYIKSHLTSSLKIVVADNGTDKVIILTIPTQRLGIDLSHHTKSELFKYKLEHNAPSDLYNEIMRNYVNKEDDYKEFPNNEGLWAYYVLNEVIIKAEGHEEYFLAKSFTDRLENVIINKGDYFPKKNTSFISFVLTALFKNESNWIVCKSYSQTKDIDKCWLPYYVICYENHSYIDVDGCYCIEKENPIGDIVFDDLAKEKEFYIFACGDSSSAFSEIEFLGVYKFDLEKSKEKGHLTFHLRQKYNITL